MNTSGSIQLKRIVPGVALASGIGLTAWAVAAAESRVFGHAFLGDVVLAILLGMLLRAFWAPGERWTPGISFTAKPLLEVAVVLMGATANAGALLGAGFPLLAMVAAVVVLSILLGTALGRAFGLGPRLALLVACGNSICGSSAIATIAPVIEADEDEVATSLTFTALMSMLVVLGLPLLLAVLRLSYYQYGVLAGLSVYAVPQVLAATVPVNALSGQIGTLIKLTRVMMLGPVTVLLALVYRKRTISSDGPSTGRAVPDLKRIARMLPPFVAGFFLLATARSLNWLPENSAAPLQQVSTALTVAAMAALGLSADIRAVKKAGRAVILTVTISLAALVVLSLLVIRMLGI